MAPVVTDISKLVSFPQPGIHYHIGDDEADHDSVVAFRSGQIITIMWALALDIAPGTPLDHIEMILPLGFQGEPVHGASGNYSYSVPLAPAPATPVPGPQKAAGAYIDSSKHPPDRIVFYPNDWGVFPAINDYFITGQMTYIAGS